ncbi:MAG: lamin tail domain-containing protein [Candidatus Gracilibacteria bacterium]
MKKIIIAIFGLYMSTMPLSTCVAGTFDTSNSPLLITEIMPNPKGADKGQEWVELYNTTEQRISLSNWKLNNGKVFSIPDGLSILPKGYFILQDSNLKITLKNSNSTIFLINPNDTSVQEISYQKTTEDQSYSMINIKTQSSTKHSWEWTTPTKGENNQTIYLITGKITTPPQIEKDFYFEITPENSKDQKIKIIFIDTKFEFELMQTLFKPDTEASILVEKSSDKYILKDFQIKTSQSEQQQAKTDQSPQKTHWEYFLLIPIIALTSTLIYMSKHPKAFSLPS